MAVPPSSDGAASLPTPVVASPPTPVVESPPSLGAPPPSVKVASGLPELSPLTVPALTPLLVPELLPLPVTPLAWPPQATIARRANAEGNLRQRLKNDGTGMARALSHQTGRLTCGYRNAKRSPSTSASICHEICHAEPPKPSRHLPTPLSKRRYFPTNPRSADGTGTA